MFHFNLTARICYPINIILFLSYVYVVVYVVNIIHDCITFTAIIFPSLRRKFMSQVRT